MNQRKPLPGDDLLAIIKRFGQMQEEGKALYLDAEQYEDIVEYYIYNKEYTKAMEAIEMALQIHPDNTRLIATRVALYIDEEKLEEARETLDKILDDNAFHVRLIHAELLVMEGKDEEAGRLIDAFEEEDTDEIDCLDIGILCSDVAFDDKALYWLRKCMKLNPENEEAILAICECYQNMSNYNETIPLYNKLIDKNPYSAEGWSGLAKSYFHLGQLDKAIEACDFALVSDDKAEEAYAIKGHAYYQLENYQEAVKAYKEASRLGSLEPEFAPMFIAFSYVGMEDWNNAYGYIKEAMAVTDEDSPVYPDLLINSARCLFSMDQDKEGHRTLETVKKRFPDNVFAYIYSGKYYLEEGDYDNATKNFEKALKISPTIDTWYQIGIFAMNCGEYEIAKEAFNSIREINPDYEDLPQHLAYVNNKLLDDKSMWVNKKAFKRIKEMIEHEEYPNAFDFDACVRRAKEEGLSEEEVDELVTALAQLRKIMEDFDVDQEENLMN